VCSILPGKVEFKPEAGQERLLSNLKQKQPEEPQKELTSPRPSSLLGKVLRSCKMAVSHFFDKWQR
jgi:hypothetical protein